MKHTGGRSPPYGGNHGNRSSQTPLRTRRLPLRSRERTAVLQRALPQGRSESRSCRSAHPGWRVRLRTFRVHRQVIRTDERSLHRTQTQGASVKGSFQNKVVAITGASAGVGRATALAFAKQGAKVGLIARGEEGLESTRREIELAGGQAVACSADVADASALDEAADRIVRELG